MENLLDLRGFEDEVGVISDEAEMEPRLLVLALPNGSVTDFERSRLVCFCKNLGSLDGGGAGGDVGDGVCRSFLLGIMMN
jgi:hypothetical protein